MLPSEIQALMKHALQASPLPSANPPLRSAENHSDEERFNRLIDAIHFSKSFILTYQLVLVGFLLVFTVAHWGSRLRAWRRRKRNRGRIRVRRENLGSVIASVKKTPGVRVFERTEDGYSGSSSSSSTLQGDCSPRHSDLDQDEQTPLLKAQPTRLRAPGWTSSSRVRAWLVYQPRPIPIINKTLPANSTTLAVLALIGLQIFYVSFKTPLSLSTLFVFADRTSLVFVANLPLLYLFAAKNQPLVVLTGYSYESLNIVHRRLGELMCLLAFLHSAGMIGVWYTLLKPAGMDLVQFLLKKIILLGLGALVAYELIYFTSLGSFRQRWYELFLGLHVVLQAAALVLVWLHHSGSRPYVGVALAIFLIDRLVYRMSIKIKTLKASLEVKEDGRTVVVRTVLPLGNNRLNNRNLLSSIFGSNVCQSWKATEHVFLTVPSLARKHIIQAHPFTIASKAPAAGDEKDPTLELLIRAQDGFSGDLVRYAKSHDAATIRLDGPYGSQSAVRLVQDSDHAIIVAGGSGIAVAWPLVWSAFEEGMTIEDLENPGDSTHEMKKKKILFVWVIRERSHQSWLSEEKLDQLRRRGVTLVIPAPTARQGHPDICRIIWDWTSDLDARASRPGSIGVVVSGPDSMNRVVRNTCAGMIRQGRNVSVEVEKFGW